TTVLLPGVLLNPAPRMISVEAFAGMAPVLVRTFKAGAGAASRRPDCVPEAMAITLSPGNNRFRITAAGEKLPTMELFPNCPDSFAPHAARVPSEQSAKLKSFPAWMSL